jgi:hypothetical protein
MPLYRIEAATWKSPDVMTGAPAFQARVSGKIVPPRRLKDVQEL